ncbi:MAG: hypothetical protein K6E67_07655 [Prevotella sp.]|nr:hypothetical protein [Prevotella sp.]
MKRYTVILFSMLLTLMVSAQDQKKFSPEKFQADLEEFITKEAHFDQQEAAKFFPLLRELQAKQRAIYGRMRQTPKPGDDAKCAEAIREWDKANIELKQLDQQYHKKMMQVVPASKLFDAIMAESRFHRKMMKGWRDQNGPFPPKGKSKDKRR